MQFHGYLSSLNAQETLSSCLISERIPKIHFDKLKSASWQGMQRTCNWSMKNKKRTLFYNVQSALRACSPTTLQLSEFSQHPGRMIYYHCNISVVFRQSQFIVLLFFYSSYTPLFNYKLLLVQFYHQKFDLLKIIWFISQCADI